jgi:hypothetical protein
MTPAQLMILSEAGHELATRAQKPKAPMGTLGDLMAFASGKAPRG